MTFVAMVMSLADAGNEVILSIPWCVSCSIQSTMNLFSKFKYFNHWNNTNILAQLRVRQSGECNKTFSMKYIPSLALSKKGEAGAQLGRKYNRLSSLLNSIVETRRFQANSEQTNGPFIQPDMYDYYDQQYMKRVDIQETSKGGRMLPSEGNWEEKGILVTNGASEHISTSRCLC